MQINGKTVERITFAANSDEETVRRQVLEHEKVKGKLKGKAIAKVIVIKKRLVNIVAN